MEQRAEAPAQAQLQRESARHEQAEGKAGQDEDAEEVHESPKYGQAARTIGFLRKRAAKAGSLAWPPLCKPVVALNLRPAPGGEPRRRDFALRAPPGQRLAGASDEPHVRGSSALSTAQRPADAGTGAFRAVDLACSRASRAGTPAREAFAAPAFARLHAVREAPDPLSHGAGRSTHAGASHACSNEQAWRARASSEKSPPGVRVVGAGPPGSSPVYEPALSWLAPHAQRVRRGQHAGA